jgi:transaldolase
MKENPLSKLETFGQSVWLDYIQRDLVIGGQLKRMIREDKIKGITSNPSIFEKAISGCHDYDAAIQTLVQDGKSVSEIYDVLSIQDVQAAANEFHPVYDITGAWMAMSVSKLTPTWNMTPGQRCGKLEGCGHC